MHLISSIKGKVKFPITLDIGSWIFDDRRVDLDTYFDENHKEEEEEESYAQKLSRFWDREIQESNVNPPTLKTERKYERHKMLTGSFGIHLKHFFNLVEPHEDATKLIIETKEEDIELPLTKVPEIMMAFSHKGKPLKEDGPIHIIYQDGSNKDEPIKHVKSFRVE